MGKSIKVHQKKPGRPATGRDPAVTIRLPEKVLDDVETWAAKQGGDLNRSQAIRRLVELGLKAKGK
jgi:ribbon-helix-helix CopG family protein